MSDRDERSRLLKALSGADDEASSKVVRAIERAGDDELTIATAPGHELRPTYSVRGELLVERGVDVAGIDALVAAIDAQPGQSFTVFVVHGEHENYGGFVDDAWSLIGIVAIPKDLPLLPA